MYDVLFEEIKSEVVLLLDALNPYLTYHNLDHTLDVVKQSERIAVQEGVVNARELFLLKVAALYHDTGFLNTYPHHEEESCRIFNQHARGYAFSDDEKSLIEGLIMATKIPQQPQSRLQKIICDADLDYLGRSDFFIIGDELRREFLHYRIVKSDEEWEKMQFNFLQNHQYHTASSRKDREVIKRENLKMLV
jgi:uncharacterized protein